MPPTSNIHHKSVGPVHSTLGVGTNSSGGPSLEFGSATLPQHYGLQVGPASVKQSRTNATSRSRQRQQIDLNSQGDLIAHSVHASDAARSTRHIPRLPLRAIIAEDGDLDENDQVTASIKATILPGNLPPQTYRIEKHPSNDQVCRLTNLLANLSHPHICTLYAMGDRFLVTTAWDETLQNCLHHLAHEKESRRNDNMNDNEHQASHRQCLHSLRSTTSKGSPRRGRVSLKSPLGSAINIFGAKPSNQQRNQQPAHRKPPRVASRMGTTGVPRPLSIRSPSICSVGDSARGSRSEVKLEEPFSLSHGDHIQLLRDVALPVTRALVYLHTQCKMAFLNLSMEKAIVLDWGHNLVPTVYLRDFTKATELKSFDPIDDPRSQDILDLGRLLDALAIAQPLPPGEGAARLFRLIAACCHTSPQKRPTIRRVHKRILELLSTEYQRKDPDHYQSTFVPVLDGSPKASPVRSNKTSDSLSRNQDLHNRYNSHERSTVPPLPSSKLVIGWSETSTTTASMTDSDSYSAVSSGASSLTGT